MDCQCNTCKGACQKRPGWFAPGEVAKAAALLGMSEQDFFDKYVGVDYYAPDEEKDHAVFSLAPITVGNQPGTEYPFDPHGTCTFFQEGLCLIHAAKPNECKFYDHTTLRDVASKNRDEVVTMWEANQDEIRRLLGREPVLVKPNFLEMLSMLVSYYKTGGS